MSYLCTLKNHHYHRLKECEKNHVYTICQKQSFVKTNAKRKCLKIMVETKEKGGKGETLDRTKTRKTFERVNKS